MNSIRRINKQEKISKENLDSIVVLLLESNEDMNLCKIIRNFTDRTNASINFEALKVVDEIRECSSCLHEDIHDDTKFCPNCGIKIERKKNG